MERGLEMDPSTSLATLRPELGGSLEEYDLEAGRKGFIGDRVLPVTEVGKPSGEYGIISLEQLLQNKDTRRATGGAYARGSWKFTDASFQTKEHGWEEPVDEREAEIYKEYFDAEVVSAQRARDFVLRNREIRIADLIQNSSTWTATDVTNEWDDAPNATPIADVKAAQIRMFEAVGLWPNAVIINRPVFLNLRAVAEVIARIESSGSGDRSKAADITPADLADVFDLGEVIVAGSAKNTANEEATVSISSIWSNEYASVVKLAREMDIKEPALGRTFHYGADGSEMGALMESYRDEPVRSDIIRARIETDEVIVYTECQELLGNITT